MLAPPEASAETSIATGALNETRALAPAPTAPLIPGPTTSRPSQEAALQHEQAPIEERQLEQDQYPNIIFFDGQDFRSNFDIIRDFDATLIDMDDDDLNAA